MKYFAARKFNRQTDSKPMNTKTSITQNLFGAKSWRLCLRLLIALVLLGWGAMVQAQNSDVWTNGSGNNQ